MTPGFAFHASGAAAPECASRPLQAFVAVSFFVRRHVCLAWADLLRVAAPGALATLGAAAGIVAVMALRGFRSALPFGQMLVAILAAGLGWLAGLWLSDQPLIGELRSLWGQVRQWA